MVAAVLAIGIGATQSGESAEGGTGAKKDAKGPNIDRTKRVNSQQADAVVMAQLADQLITYGDRNKDALALITAARIQNQIGVQFQKSERKHGRTPPKDAKGDKPGRDHATAASLERARQYAGGRKDLIALADEAAKTGARGAVRGPRGWTERVQAGMYDYYSIAFNGGELARFGISGDGDTDLDLFVKDEYGNVICRQEGPTDDEMCSWVPKWTATYRIEVHNLNKKVYNEYRSRHN
jgi:hypothetical protein